MPACRQQGSCPARRPGGVDAGGVLDGGALVCASNGQAEVTKIIATKRRIFLGIITSGGIHHDWNKI